MSIQTMIFRMMCKRSDTARDRGLTVPERVKCLRNIRYGKNKKYHLLDIYLPKNVKGPVPTIVNFHGGGWVYGTKETYQFYCMSLAEQGFAVVNPNYCLAPKYRFPKAFKDINAVFGFVKKNAAEYGLDINNLFGIGDSAGAAGMAIYAGLLSNPRYASEFPVKTPKGIRLKALALNCGSYTAIGKADFFVNILPKENADDVLRLLHLVDYVTPGYPPCYLLTATDDFLKDEQKPMEEALKKNGVRYISKIYGDENNRLGHVFHCNIRDKNAVEANHDEMEFFRSFIAEE